MKTIYLFFFCIAFSFLSCNAQSATDEQESGFVFHINKTVTNAEEEDEKAIINLWQEYLKSGDYFRPDSPLWNYENARYPQVFLANIYIREMYESEKTIQVNILGVFPVEHNHYAVKTMFSTVDKNTLQVTLETIITVYAKKFKDKFQLVSSTQYHRQTWEKNVVGNISFFLHPDHTFDETKAIKMNEFNNMLAEKYQTEPIIFDYFVSNYSREISEMIGYDFKNSTYQKVQSGGMANIYNNTIYAGNNSEYYPHEVVHLYNYHRNRRKPHHAWIDEGIATFFGGSTEFPLEWHLQKLKSFLAENPDYEIKDLKKLEIDIPNGEYTTDFRYAIGGFLMKRIYEKEGMNGFFEALESGKSEEEYFAFLKLKLGFEREDFGNFVKTEIKQE